MMAGGAAPYALIGGMAMLAIAVGLLAALFAYRWRGRAIARLKENDRRLRSLVDELAFREQAMNAHSIVSEADATGRITHVNEKFCEVSGYSRDELLGGNHRIMRSDFHPPEFFRAMWETIGNGRIWHGEIRNRAKDGRLYWVSTTIVPMLDERGVPVRYVSVRTEITHLHELLSELAFREKAMDAHSIVSEADATGRITRVNDKFCEVSGYARGELVGTNHRIVKSDFHPPEFFRSMWETISHGQAWHGEVRNRAKSGRHYWVATTIVPKMDAHGLPERYVSVRTDITKIKGMEAAVREANAILRSDIVQRTRELEVAKQQLEQELQDRVRTLGALQTSHDELKRLHAQLQEAQQYLMHSEKLAAVGQLAAGMAHEINNPIGFVTANLAALGRYQETVERVLGGYRQIENEVPEESQIALIALRTEAELEFLIEDARALLAESREGMDRVRKIVQDLRDFSQVDRAGQRQRADINHCLETTVNLLRARLPPGVRIHCQPGEVPEIECSPADLNQVFVNLLNNALQALGGEGDISVRSGMADDCLWVEIEDTGVGIPEAVLPNIFDPFFTTRPVGQGVGLGLSTAYGVVQQHGGRIDVKSRSGAGTVFRVTLPSSVPRPGPWAKDVAPGLGEASQAWQ